jgi:hypothetical protein
MDDPASRVGAWSPDGSSTPKPSEDDLIAACATVYDPEIPVNIYELGLIFSIDLTDTGDVKVEMTLTAPGCPSAQELPESRCGTPFWRCLGFRPARWRLSGSRRGISRG